MKNKYIWMLGTWMCTVSAFTSCQDIVTYEEEMDDSEFVSTGAPVIEGVYTPDGMETPVTGADLGEMIVLKGKNLSNVTQIRLNDRKVSLSEVYATASRVYFPVPGEVPTDITNKLYFETELGYTTTDFKVIIPSLVVTGLYNEFALPGSDVQIVGGYFDIYGFGGENERSVVTMNGTALVVKEVTSTSMTVTLPNDISDNGSIQVTYVGTEGETVFNIPYRQSNSIVWNLSNPDGYSFWAGTSLITDGNNAGDPQALCGPYFRVKGNYSGWSWNNLLCGGFNLSEEVASNPSAYWLKFEVSSSKNTPFYDSATAGYIIQLNSGSYAWNPSSSNSFNTYGEWATVRLELTSVATNGLSAGWTNFFWIMQPNSDWTVDHSFANIRIEKKQN